MAEYIFNNSNDVIFLLTGYAGTGKTSVISAVVRTLDLLRIKSVLMAPTGRAAKFWHHTPENKHTPSTEDIPSEIYKRRNRQLCS